MEDVASNTVNWIRANKILISKNRRKQRIINDNENVVIKQRNSLIFGKVLKLTSLKIDE